jgi:hypothetical protein
MQGDGMKGLLLLLNAACIVADVYGIVYWHESRWTVLLAANVVSFVIVALTAREA